jgi:hypothetical protein
MLLCKIMLNLVSFSSSFLLSPAFLSSGFPIMFYIYR